MTSRALAWAALGLSLLTSAAVAWHLSECEALEQMAWDCCADAGRVC